MSKPVVLVLAGHDPSGGAGLQADIESIAAAGCHAVSVITCLTVQNTAAVIDVVPQPADLFKRQLDHLMKDITISACKIGVIVSPALVEVAAQALSAMEVPVVIDPVLEAGTGQVLVNEETRQTLIDRLWPLAEIITPNSIEAKTLSGAETPDAAAEVLLQHGTKSILVTGTHEATTDVVNTLYRAGDDPMPYHWPRLAGTFHGSGCTLSAHIAARLALGDRLEEAVAKAQEYTWGTLQRGLPIGAGQALPDRFYRNPADDHQ